MTSSSRSQKKKQETSSSDTIKFAHVIELLWWQIFPVDCISHVNTHVQRSMSFLSKFLMFSPMLSPGKPGPHVWCVSTANTNVRVQQGVRGQEQACGCDVRTTSQRANGASRRLPRQDFVPNNRETTHSQDDLILAKIPTNLST